MGGPASGAPGAGACVAPEDFRCEISEIQDGVLSYTPFELHLYTTQALANPATEARSDGFWETGCEKMRHSDIKPLSQHHTHAHTCKVPLRSGTGPKGSFRIHRDLTWCFTAH